jgi:ABC-2 type transport system permease protein
VAGLTPEGREQLRAVATLRWRLLANSLRSVRGRVNLVSRVVAGLFVAGAAVGGAFVIGGAAWELTRTRKLPWLAVFFWIIFLFWQFFPVMATAFTANEDTSSLLRFPLTYRTYFLVRMVFGTLDIATTLGLCWVLGLLGGISAGAPRLIPWAVTAVLTFVLFNLLIARLTFVWIEHWLSRRRSREIMGLLFFVVIISLQFIGPALGRYSKVPAVKRFQYASRLNPVQRVLPPGLAAVMLTTAEQGNLPAALTSLALVGAYSGAALLLLHLRLRKQYRGENPEGNSGKAKAAVDGVPRRGWKLPLLPAPVAAVFEKELRYFSRSGPMIFTMIMPMVVILLLGSGKRSLFAQQSEFFFPVGAAYCLLVMTNLVYNSFGGDGGGIQFFLMAPVSFRRIVFAKNLAQFTVLVVEVAVLLLGVTLVYHSPHGVFLVLTFCWYLFAAPLNFSAGNLLSVYAPKRIDYAIFGRQRASETTILASLGVQIVVMGTGALAIFLGYHFRDYWLGAVILSALAIPSIAGYVILLRRMDRIVMKRREVLAAELCKA